MHQSTPEEIDQIAREICKLESLNFGEFLGQGQFKRVYSVTDASGVSAALKVLRSSADLRATREVEAIKTCCHPNIASLHRAGRHNLGGTTWDFVVEELLDGGSLTDRMEEELSRTDVIELVRGLSGALSHLKDLKLVHRDIKPDNVMYRVGSNRPILVDFGLVRNLNDVSLTATWQTQGPGTPYYSAPEQLRNEKHLIDWRTDQFSLGVTVCVAAMSFHPYQAPGEPPFDRRTVERVVERSGIDDSRRQTLADVGLEPIAKMVSPFPLDRFRTPEELQQAWTEVGGN
jgi:serine/threonine protein kinase